MAQPRPKFITKRAFIAYLKARPSKRFRRRSVDCCPLACALERPVALYDRMPLWAHNLIVDVDNRMGGIGTAAVLRLLGVRS